MQPIATVLYTNGNLIFLYIKINYKLENLKLSLCTRRDLNPQNLFVRSEALYPVELRVLRVILYHSSLYEIQHLRCYNTHIW